jgi:hypothetical protein
MAHNVSCANATTRSCRCGGCAGSLHGWTGALVLAHPGMAGARAANHRAVDQAWDEAAKPRRKRRPMRRMARSAADAAKADITDWLANSMSDPCDSAGELVASVGDAISADIFDALCAALGSGNRNEVRAELAEKHLFCSLLAECAHAMQEIKDDLDQAIEDITRALLDYCVGRKKIKIPPLVAKAAGETAAKAIDKLAGSLPATRHLDDLLRAVRVLAVLACPAPEKHEAVVRYALEPLGEPAVSSLVQDRLKTAMPVWAA